MEILQLKYFYESAKSESFSNTAKKYMVPTTSVSASVKRLEHELGCELFERRANRISLNAKGKLLMQSLYKVFSELDLVTEELSAFENDTREIKILARALRSDITESIIGFRKKHPNVAFKLTLDFNDKNIEDYDIIIDEKNPNYPDHECFDICSMPLKLLASSESPLCGKRISLQSLENSSFVSWGEGSNMHNILVSSCHRAGFSPNISVTTNDNKCYDRLIESGIGIGIARKDSPVLNKGTVKVLNVSDFDPVYTVCCYYKKQSVYGNIKTFLSFLKEAKQS